MDGSGLHEDIETLHIANIIKHMPVDKTYSRALKLSLSHRGIKSSIFTHAKDFWRQDQQKREK